MKIGLFFGSFNPIHNGHLIIAQAMLNYSEIEEVWFVVSPQNPLKSSKSLIHHFDRIDMVELAIESNDRFKASDIEFNLPVPSYTIDTLAYISQKHKKHDFKLIIGEDNLSIFPKWKNSEQILKYYGLLVYHRDGFSSDSPVEHNNIKYIKAPLINLSATLIRRNLKERKSIKYLVPEKVEQFILERKLFV